VAGHILIHAWFGELEVSYWLGREFWGRGIATQALAAFLEVIHTRPLYARAAQDNRASIRVLEKNGFKVYADERGFANARGEEIDEVVMDFV
jgi:RimJ/RimL family protein N-acetyltransferase